MPEVVPERAMQRWSRAGKTKPENDLRAIEKSSNPDEKESRSRASGKPSRIWDLSRGSPVVEGL